ncbi:MAG: helix-turn-helix domain-containing protein [Chloroflexi bacterium]|nr:MAG: helix-turn-helix domain-containing protein [Chloroflexota bacterium]TMB92128.1 MAG: helix-turn-helix domain-containing protein [Chloroflexota bacterium]TMC28626.1 MAG: helix-turn-helix domain-containing protein [Chloroflexota bacterium]TMC37107.1 MAG: helix-turn-helix domain-containing protein [Chloroflexota bacterium]TMC58435.1 MAG: helix-turn-helix domain-containing protein [Chloroflexota bacterium]
MRRRDPLLVRPRATRSARRFRGGFLTDLISPPVPEQPTPTPVAPAPPKAVTTPGKVEEARPDPLAASVAAAIAKLRRDAGLSERAAAKKLATSQTQLRRMEDPRYLPSLRSLSRVANAYGAELKVSFQSHDDKPKEKTEPSRPAAKPAGERTPSRPPARASASPSKGRRAAPGRARAVGRRSPRRVARRRRG